MDEQPPQVDAAKLESLIDKAKRQPLESVLAKQDRMTVNFSAHYQQDRNDAVSVDVHFSAMLPQADEGPLQRSGTKVKATEQWAPLNFWWLEDCPGMVVIENLEGRHFDVQPTPEEKADAAKRVIVVRTDPGQANLHRIAPGHAWPFDVERPEMIEVRCVHGDAHYCLTVFPRAKEA